MTLQEITEALCGVADTDHVLSVLRAHRIRYCREAELQAAVERILDQAGIKYDREFRLDQRNRIDFLTRRGVGIELKVDSAPNTVLAQLLKYASHERVKALVLVTTRPAHCELAEPLRGKPVHVHVVGGLG